MLRDIQTTLTACEALLARRGIVGAFTMTGCRVTWSRWSSSRQETAEALREAEDALLRAGFDVVQMPGVGVVVQGIALEQVSGWRDGEAAVHSGEPLPETEAECLAAE